MSRALKYIYVHFKKVANRTDAISYSQAPIQKNQSIHGLRKQARAQARAHLKLLITFWIVEIPLGGRHKIDDQRKNIPSEDKGDDCGAN